MLSLKSQLACLMVLFGAVSVLANDNLLSDSNKCPSALSVAYCTPSETIPWNDYITGVTIGSIENTNQSNPNSGSSPIGIGDYTSFSTDVIAGKTYPITINSIYEWYNPNATGEGYVRIWIDYNGDEDFEDAGELAVEHLEVLDTSQTSTGYTINLNVAVPSDATLGASRMRIVVYRDALNVPPCPANSIYGEFEDYTLNIVPYCTAGPTITGNDYITGVTFGSIQNAVQPPSEEKSNNTTPEGVHDYTDMIATVETGSTYPIHVTAKVGWYNQNLDGVGIFRAWIDFNKDGDFDDPGELSVDENFVLTYDMLYQNYNIDQDIAIPAGATIGETRMRLLIIHNSTPHGPCDTIPFRGEYEDYTLNLIEPGGDPVPYCTVGPTITGHDYITGVTFESIQNAVQPPSEEKSDNTTPEGVHDYTDMIATVEAGSTYPIQVTAKLGWYNQNLDGVGIFRAWIDFNKDGDFDDPGELSVDENFVLTYDMLYQNYNIDQDITIPAGAATGETRMRLLIIHNSTPHGPCDTIPFRGEYEEYTLNLVEPGGDPVPYCTVGPTITGHDYITGVTFGSIQNAVQPPAEEKSDTTTPEGVHDYTDMIAIVEAGSTYPIHVTAKLGWYNQNLDGVGIFRAWIDFNKDGDFDDPGELSVDENFVLTYDMLYQNYNIDQDIAIPAGAATGETRMRLLIIHNSTPHGPCDTIPFRGEYEDYTLNLVPAGSINTAQFIDLKRQLDGSYVNVDNDYIRFRYNEDYAVIDGPESNLICKVFDWHRTELYNISMNKEYGVNWKELLLPNGVLTEGEYYILEVHNANKDDIYFLRFKY